MNFFDKLMQSGFFSKAEEELEEARIVTDKRIDELPDYTYDDLWHFASKTKEEEFSWIMHEIEAYDVLREEYLANPQEDIFAIRGDEAGDDFTLLFSLDAEVIETIREQTLNLSGKFPYYFTSFKLNSQEIYVLLYTNFVEFPGFNLN